MVGRVGVLYMKLFTPPPRKPCLPFPFQKNNSFYPIRLLYFSVVQVLCKRTILLKKILSFNRLTVEKTPPPLQHGIPFLFQLVTMKRTCDAEHLFQHSLIVCIFIIQCTHKISLSEKSEIIIIVNLNHTNVFIQASK